jgi:LysM repeat protein
VPFEQTIEGIQENCRMDTKIEVNSQEFLNQSGVVSANIDLNFETDSYRTTLIPVINDITSTQQDEMEDYSVIIYVVKAGDTLWKIAKRFGSTVDDIVRVNGIERPDRLNVGEKIYIPKYVLKRAKEPITLSTHV